MVLAVLNETLLKKDGLFLISGKMEQFRVLDFLLKPLSCLQGRIPGSRAGQLQGGIEPHGLLQHILFRTPVSQEAFGPSTHRKDAY